MVYAVRITVLRSEVVMRAISCLVLAGVVLCGCAQEPELDEPSALEGRAELTGGYLVVKYPSLGRSPSRGMAINKQGWVAGWSTRSDGLRRAARWRGNSIADLGTLGGPQSTVPWPGLNDENMVVGISLTADVDPLDEDWSCELGGFIPGSTNLICRGFVYQHGVMRSLPTLGGNHGFATGVNNRGQIVGWAETPVHDPTCTDAQVLQFRAVLWEPRKATIEKRELSPLAGDSTSAATAINNLGQAVGISGACDQAVGRFSALHAVRWEPDGTITEIPNLGGMTWHTPMDINDHGDVVGFSNPPGPGDPLGDFIAQAFLWVNGSATATRIGTLDDDVLSQAFAINSRGQVVGISFGGSFGGRAFVYENGQLRKLNDVLGVTNGDVFISAQDINDKGQISGRVLDAATGQTMTFVATPIGAH
jgi:probable HAF family extracellular repeat protein